MAEPITADERFWPLERPALAAWRRAGVLRAGLGCYRRGWKIAHPRSARHLVAICLGGTGSVGTAQALEPGTAWVAPAGLNQELQARGEWRLAWWYLDPALWSVPRLRLVACQRVDLLQLAADELCRETRAPSAKPVAPSRPDPRPPSEDRAWLLAGLLLCEVRRVMAEAGADAADHPRRRRWRAALAALRSDPGAAWSVSALAARTGVSEPTLRRLVRDEHGCSVRDLIAAERMVMARQLLRLTDLSQTEIADRVGYADPFAFARAFHRQEGCWPSQLRAKAGGESSAQNRAISPKRMINPEPE